jgi:hypothetical protein
MKSGCYACDARVVLKYRTGADPLPGNLTLGLLTAAPSPEGWDAEELAAPGYARQPIEFDPAPSAHPGVKRLNTHRISFGPIGDYVAGVSHAAVFDAEGKVVAYAWFQTCPGYIDGAEVVFDGGRVTLRY